MSPTTSFQEILNNSSAKILVFGYGNLGRQDDGLGIEFTERLEKLNPSNSVKNNLITIDSNYQLNIEDALLISSYDVVFFIDATVEEKAQAPYQIRELQPVEMMGISSHSMSPATVLSFCQNLYQKFPRCYLVTLPGYEWEFQEGLTPKAEKNLQQSISDFTLALESLHA